MAEIELSLDQRHSKNCGQESSRAAAKISLGKSEKKWGVGRAPSCVITSYKDSSSSREAQQVPLPAARSRSRPAPEAAQTGTTVPGGSETAQFLPRPCPKCLTLGLAKSKQRLRPLFKLPGHTFSQSVIAPTNRVWGLCQLEREGGALAAECC